MRYTYRIVDGISARQDASYPSMNAMLNIVS
jgi:hypothetical protein